MNPPESHPHHRPRYQTRASNERAGMGDPEVCCPFLGPRDEIRQMLIPLIGARSEESQFPHSNHSSMFETSVVHLAHAKMENQNKFIDTNAAVNGILAPCKSPACSATITHIAQNTRGPAMKMTC
ncbi:Alpha-fucosidase A [Venturia inaequalis]|nr:Alpha-fucosidase A [Venturia inaequalis]